MKVKENFHAFEKKWVSLLIDLESCFRNLNLAIHFLPMFYQ